jgi:hypothetical protein
MFHFAKIIVGTSSGQQMQTEKQHLADNFTTS